ncbi:MAG: I78 family peptidase inhibitor [Yoonia sp.]|uniref:I78 family peptidase inhibitor n=1 Tax=Yoonia sp. TaxID=2212373 RepID=UPI003EFB07D8
MKQLLVMIALAGCAAASPSAGPTLPAQTDDTCNARDYAALIGAPATALERVLLLGKVRVIRPDQPVTMDYWADRINFMIDANEQIAAITCG